MAGYTPLSTVQIVNRSALPNIGAPADDLLNDILAKIDAALTGITGGIGYVAKEVSLPISTTSFSVSISAQPDTSYVVYAMMENLTDTNPQFQQPLIENKTTTGFTVRFNVPLDTANYKLCYTIPFKSFDSSEDSISSSSTSITNTFSIPKNGASFGVISAIENYGDTNPQFQTSVISVQSSSSFTSKWNAPTDTINYVNSYTLNATGQSTIGSTTTSVVLTLPINYNTTSYAVMAVMKDTSDTNPQFQPLLVTNKTDTTITVSWNMSTDTSNYSIYYYIISLTP